VTVVGIFLKKSIVVTLGCSKSCEEGCQDGQNVARGGVENSV
jgi:hypothetical protein